MKLAPIALFVYSRLSHTMSTVEALAKNTLAKESELFVFSDGAKSNSDKEQVNRIRDYVDTIEYLGYFKKVHVFKSDINKGLADSIINGVTEVLNVNSSIIVLEDDLETSPCFLNYMNNSLNFYINTPGIGCISGYSPIKEHLLPNDYHGDIYVSGRNCSIGWATWADVWEKVDWECADYASFKFNFKARRLFDRFGCDRSIRLDNQIKHDLNSWSIRFGFSLFTRGLKVIYPVESRINHLGWDGSGTHSRNLSIANNVFNKRIPRVPIETVFELPSENTAIIKQMRYIYSGSTLYELKSFLVSIRFSLLKFFLDV